MVLDDSKEANRKFYFLHIEMKETQEQIGSIGYTVIDNTPLGKIVNAGYLIYPKFLGKGYTTKALKSHAEMLIN